MTSARTSGLETRTPDPQAVSTVVWGTFDKGKPRVRILLKGLSEAGYPVIEQHSSPWDGIEDKSQIQGFFNKGRIALSWLSRYPWLLCRYCFAPKHSVVLLPYLSHLDVLMIWPLAKLRGAMIVWDVFVPLYTGVVEDRRLVSEGSLSARLIYALEWLSTRAADLLFLDTTAHAEYFARLYGLPEASVGSVMVGVEPEYFRPLSRPKPITKNNDEPLLNVLFYGQFIPLHGVDIILEAARRSQDRRIHWTIIGNGQSASKWKKELAQNPIENLNWLEWVKYDALIQHIDTADLCLGIFGNTQKAEIVVPNKVYQMLASGKPVITRRSRAMEELAADQELNLILVEANDPEGLVEAIQGFAAQAGPGNPEQAKPEPDDVSKSLIANKFGPLAVANQYSRMLGDFLARSRKYSELD
ncbi:MAG: hypothetical protein CME02_02095 [Geminicoccus sp.]|nr:hypothetical protein [Geminicoccus sp.]